jgi:hypothetical protein
MLLVPRQTLCSRMRGSGVLAFLAVKWTEAAERRFDSVCIDAIKIAREIFARLKNFINYRISATLQACRLPGNFSQFFESI